MDTTESRTGSESGQANNAKGRVFNIRITAFGLAACAIGLLLWSRLILVTNHPRTAIAEPPVLQTDSPKHALETPQSKRTDVHAPGELANGPNQE